MRNGILSILLTISAGSGLATGQRYYAAPQYPHPAYGRAGAAPGQMVPPRFQSNNGGVRPISAYGPNPNVRRAAYSAYPPVSAMPASYNHPLQNGESPPITIIPESELPTAPPKVNTQTPETLTFPPMPVARPPVEILPNAPSPTPDASPNTTGGAAPPFGVLPTLPDGSKMPVGKVVDPETGVEELQPGSAIFYGEDALDCGPECLPECAEPPVFAAPIVIPPRFPLGYKFYGSAAYLYWWVRGQSSPVLLDFAAFGPSAALRIGGGDLPFDNRQRNGVRGTLGMWLDRNQLWAVEGAWLYMFERSPTYKTASPPAAPLSRPFIAVPGEIPSSVLVSAPGIFRGNATVESFHRLWSVEAHLRRNLLRRESWWFDVFGGFRFLDLSERLSIDTNSTSLATGSSLFVADRFATRNEFSAAQFGAQGEWQFWRMFVNAYGKFAMGRNVQTVDIIGARSATSSTGTVTAASAGFLAQPSNIGRHRRSQFSILPEAGVNVGFAVSDSFRFSLGYSFLFLTEVARPGNHVPTRINPSQSTGAPAGPAVPIFEFSDEDYWAHGINVNFEFRY